MKIIEVKTSKQIKEFLLMQPRLYQNQINYIRPLDRDIENVFDRKKNKTFRHGECNRWIFQDSRNKTIGRVAAFINYKTVNRQNEQPAGGMGFFECINEEKAAFILFDTCKNWLKRKGMEAMDGPVNFGERNSWWGLLVDGFDIPPIYGMNYHFPYYQNLFEKYGFQVYFKQYTLGRKVLGSLSEKLHRKARIIAQYQQYSFKHIDIKKVDMYAENFREIYNKAWAKHEGVAKINQVQARAILNQFKPIIDERIIWFGYFKEQPIAFFIMIPDINQIFKYLNGRFDWWGKIKFLYYKYTVKINKMFGVAFGVIPEFQRRGVDGALIMAAAEMVQKKHYYYEDVEFNWIGDFNPKMLIVAKQGNTEIVKTHITYRKLFDETKPFERMKIIK